MKIQSLAGRKIRKTPKVERISRGRAATVIMLSGRKTKVKKTPMGYRDPKKVTESWQKRVKEARAQGRASALRSIAAPKRKKSVIRKDPPQGVKVVRTPARKGRTLILAGRTGRLMGGFTPTLKNLTASIKPVGIGVVGAIAGLGVVQFTGKYIAMSQRTTNLVGLGLGVALPFAVKRPEAKIAGFGLAILSGYNLIWDAWGPQIKSLLRLNGSTAFTTPPSLNGATAFGPAPALAGATAFVPAPMSGYRVEDEGM